MRHPKPDLSVRVDLTNPGQFFACCGLLELAHRLWPGSEGWFNDGVFHITAPATGASITSLTDRIRNAQLYPDTDNGAVDEKTCPLHLRDAVAADVSTPLSLRLDWWLDKAGVGGSLKTWAGQQRVTVISSAMLRAAIADDQIDDKWLDCGRIAHQIGSPRNVVQPFYFDARRFSHALDAGFSLDVQGVSTKAHPATEFLTLVGLQRFSQDFRFGSSDGTSLHPHPAKRNHFSTRKRRRLRRDRSSPLLAPHGG